MKNLISSFAILLYTSITFSQSKPVDSYSREEIKAEFEKYVETMPKMLQLMSSDGPLMQMGPVEPESYSRENETIAEVYDDADDSSIIKLSEENTIGTYNGKKVNLVKIDKNEAHFTVEKGIGDAIMEIQAISENGNYLDSHSKSNNDVFPEEALDYFNYLGNEMQTRLDDFDAHSTEDLKAFMNAEKDKAELILGKNPQVTKFYVRFPGNVKELILYFEKE